MTNERHNGYTNYETWLMAVLIDNDRGLQDICIDLVKENVRYKGEFYDAGKVLEEYIGDNFFVEQYSIYHINEESWTQRDFDEIDWTDIAETLVQDIELDDDAE